MNENLQPSSPESDREIVITRLINAPRELVWEAWTTPEHVSQWWGPDGFRSETERMDVRPGGIWKHVMHGPDGVDYPNKATYVEVVKPERLVYNVNGCKPGDPPVFFQATVTLEDRGGKTWLTMRSVLPSAEDRDRVVREYNAIEGGKQHVSNLEAYLANYLAKK